MFGKIFDEIISVIQNKTNGKSWNLVNNQF